MDAGFLGRWPRLLELLARWAGFANRRPVGPGSHPRFGPLDRNHKPSRRKTPSIPNVPFVDFYFVLSAQLPKLILIRSFSMMFFLLLHISQDSVQVRLAD